jgi:hypothetical protein
VNEEIGFLLVFCGMLGGREWGKAKESDYRGVTVFLALLARKIIFNLHFATINQIKNQIYIFLL